MLWTTRLDQHRMFLKMADLRSPRDNSTSVSDTTCFTMSMITIAALLTTTAGVALAVLLYHNREQLRRCLCQLKFTRARKRTRSRSEEDPLLSPTHSTDVAQDTITRLQQELAEERDKNQRLNLRLSQVMSERLRANNPNITDLSDENRPVKLAENFAELYDNEWTQAFDSLGDGFSEGEALLLNILMDTYKKCRETAECQMRGMIQQLTFIEDGELPDGTQLELDCMRKKLATQTMSPVLQIVSRHFAEIWDEISWRPVPQTAEILAYINRCSELCWLMVIQSPPVVICDPPARNTPLNRDCYKEYTRSGPSIDFVVWPVLLLHEAGGLLCKGVAQGCGVISGIDDGDDNCTKR